MKPVAAHLIEQFAQESKATLTCLNARPAAKLGFRPHRKSMRLGELAWHIVTIESWFVGGIRKGGFEGA